MRIFRESFVADELCSFGRKHKVTYNEVKEVTEVGRELKERFYGLSSVGNVPDFWYADSDGVIYYRGGTWDGVSSFLTGDDGSDFWCIRPHGTYDVIKDIEGNLLDRNGDRVANESDN